MKVGTRVSPRADNADPFETHVGTVIETDLFGEADMVMVEFDQAVLFDEPDAPGLQYPVDMVAYMVNDLVVVTE